MTPGCAAADTRRAPADPLLRAARYSRPAREVPLLKVSRIAIVAALTLFPATALAAADAPPPPTPPQTPTLFLPSPPDSEKVQAPPAPVLIPGRPYGPDSTRRTMDQVTLDFYRKGRVLEMDGNPQAAIIAYRNVVQLDPTFPDAYYRMGQIFEGFGDTPRSMEAYAAEVRHHPDNRDAARALGLALARMGESERAIQQLELLVGRDSRDGASWRALGFAYTLARRFKDAEKALRNAIAVPPDDAGEYRDLGVLLANQGRVREAREAYLKAAKLDPKDGSAVVNLANIDLRAGRPEKALERYREAETRDTMSVFAYRGEIQALAGLGRERESGEVYQRWMRRIPDDETGRLEAVQYFAHQGRPDVALELARDGLRHTPNSGYARMTLGVAYGLNGDARNSLLELRRSERMLLRTDPEGHAKAVLLIAELRSGAPDSLRALFVQDSLRFEAPPPVRPTGGAADTTAHTPVPPGAR